MLKTHTLLFLMIFLSFNSFHSCTSNDKENRNEYFVNNQSSFDLRHRIKIDESLVNVNIVSGNTEKIHSEVYKGGRFSPNIYFESTSEYIGNDIFLKRDDSGVEIEALKLNENLDWIEKISGNEFHYELIVIDEMLN